ncbi:unnamed protein product, partial [marine sediment metagenome]
GNSRDIDATILDVDDIRIDDNTISATDSSGNITISTTGVGDIELNTPAGDIILATSSNISLLTTNNANINLGNHYQITGITLNAQTSANSIIEVLDGYSVKVESVNFDDGVVSGISNLRVGNMQAISATDSSVANSANIEITIGTNSFVGNLYVVNTNVASAADRTSRIYHVTGRLNDGVDITEEYTKNGSNGTFIFTVSDNSTGSTNIIRATNYGGAASAIHMTFVGTVGF